LKVFKAEKVNSKKVWILKTIFIRVLKNILFKRTSFKRWLIGYIVRDSKR
jgi:hypothetical protein